MSKKQCSWNYDIAPSKVPGECTHIDSVSKNEQKVKMCKSLSTSDCLT